MGVACGVFFSVSMLAMMVPHRYCQQSQLFVGFCMSHMLDAAFALVRAYPGGAVSLAPRIGKAHGTLSGEVAGRPGYKLGLDDAVAISQLSGDLRILNAFAAELGCLVLHVPDGQAAGEDVMQRVGAAAKEFGEFLSEVTTDASDGDISLNDMKRIEKEWGDLLAVGQGLLTHLRAMHVAGVRQ